mmetsp:Transcript_4177/g.8967  ORF Transcript_4177/g.8967 Transcript_4177/m.8967 type:complete len:256 (+) Transcript_4177:1200-1967(+)
MSEAQLAFVIGSGGEDVSGSGEEVGGSSSGGDAGDGAGGYGDGWECGGLGWGGGRWTGCVEGFRRWGGRVRGGGGGGGNVGIDSWWRCRVACISGESGIGRIAIEDAIINSIPNGIPSILFTGTGIAIATASSFLILFHFQIRHVDHHHDRLDHRRIRRPDAQLPIRIPTTRQDRSISSQQQGVPLSQCHVHNSQILFHDVLEKEGRWNLVEPISRNGIVQAQLPVGVDSRGVDAASVVEEKCEILGCLNLREFG